MEIYKKGTAPALAAFFALATVAPAIADHDTVGADLSADGLTIVLTCESFGGLNYTLDYEVEFASDARPEQKDRKGLKDKLTYAHDKLLHEDPPKPCDAAQKLDDFSFKVLSLREASTAEKMKIWDSTGGESIRCLIEGSAALANSLREGESCGDAGSPPRGKGPKSK